MNKKKGMTRKVHMKKCYWSNIELEAKCLIGTLAMRES